MDLSPLKNSISMHDLAVRLGLEPDRGGFVRCPFHGERTASLKLYSGTGGWHCFGCGLYGDQIDFLSRYYRINFKAAVEELSRMTGVVVDMTPPRRAPRTFVYRRQAEQLRTKHKLQKIDEELGRYLREEAELSAILDRRPKDWSEIDDDFERALTRIQIVRYAIECLQYEQDEIEKSKY